MAEITFYCKNEAKQQALGECLAHFIDANRLILFLQGDLGSGKTTFVRSLMEIYEVNDRKLLHLDLYRITHPEEIEAIGLREQIAWADVCLIEWPEKAAALLPSPDLSCYIAPFNEGRQLRFSAYSPQGQTILTKVEQAQAWQD